MKTCYYLSFVAAMATMTSCYHQAAVLEDAEPTRVITLYTRATTIDKTPLNDLAWDSDESTRAITETEGSDATRATTYSTLAQESLTDLWVLDGQKVICHQTSSDTDFGSPKLTLTYGAHDLTVVATRMANAAISNTGILTGDSPKSTFAYQFEYNVVANSTQKTVTLTRQTYQLTIKADDQWPASFGQMVVTISPDYTSLNVLSLTGLAPSATPYVRTATLPASFGGTTGATINYHGFTPSADEYLTNVTLTLYAADNTTILQQHTVTDVPLQRNYRTTIHGNLFASEPSFAISVNSDFAGEKEVAL